MEFFIYTSKEIISATVWKAGVPRSKYCVRSDFEQDNINEKRWN